MTRPRAAAVLVLLAALVSGRLAAAAQRYDPHLEFRTLTTDHFFIHFHQGEELLAERLARVAEEVHIELTAWLPPQSRGRTHVILVDQTDLANGWATPLPFNTIELSAAAPPSASVIGNTDDWLRLVFAHEYTHVLHLDRSRGWPGRLRRVFGRTPVAFPNLFLPGWQVEGIATYQESVLTGRGRVLDGEFAKVLGLAAGLGRPEPIDRTNGGLIDWPSGTTHYLYGAYFHEYLAERFGEEALARLADETARRAPYFGARAFRRVFGRSLGTLWSDFLRSAAADSVPGEPVPHQRITHHGFIVGTPRWDRFVPGRILYSVRNPHGFPTLMALTPEDGRMRRIASRFLGEGLAIGRDAYYFDQLELVRNTALFSDLYRLDRGVESGRWGARSPAARLTRERRILDPDLSPDGQTIAYIVADPGRRSLAIARLDPATGALAGASHVLSGHEMQFAAPRWSPDGRYIAAERWPLHGPSEIVLVDSRTGRFETLISSSDGRNVQPSWTPDGRTLLFTSDRDGGPFNLYAFDLEARELFEVTRIAGGARGPDVSPDGTRIVYVGYTLDGYDLFTMPLDRSQWRLMERADGGPERVSPADLASAAPQPSATLVAPKYTPWRTLLPRFWSPLFAYNEEGVQAGALTAGSDALGRHAYQVEGVWNTETDRAEWNAFYVYARWRPALFASTSVDTMRIAGDTVRDTIAETGVAVPLRRVRHVQSALASFRIVQRDLVCGLGEAQCDEPRRLPGRQALRFGWAFSDARRYGYSISAEDGTAMAVTSEHARELFGSSGNADAVTAETRLFLPLGPRHAVLALRSGAGVTWGEAGARRRFTLGGPGPRESLLGFGSDRIGLLRGFRPGTFAGRHVAVVNADYRFPLARIERGRGTWPVFVRSLHGAAFTDIGHTWDDRFASAELKRSLGAELSVDAVLGYFAPVTFTGGLAWRHDGSGQVRGGLAVYARIGRAF